MTDTITTSAEAGSLADLQREGRLLTKVGTLPVVVFWHDGTALAIEDRCPHLGLPAAPGHGRGRPRHLPLAPRRASTSCRAARSTSGPTTPRGFDVDDRRRRRVRARPRRRAIPSGTCSARLRDGLEDGISLVIAKSVLGLLEARRRPARDRAHRRRVRHPLPRRGLGRGPHRARRDGQPAPPPRPARPGARARARPRVRRARHARPARRASRSAPLDDRRRAAPTGSRSWYRRFVDTRSADAAERTLATALAERGAARRRRGDDVRGGHRPRVHRRRPHASTSRTRRSRRSTTSARTRRAEVLPTLVRQTAARVASRGVRRVAPPARPRRARRAHRSTHSTTRSPTAARVAASSPTSARSAGSSSTTIPRWSSTRCSTRCAPAPTRSSSAARSRTRPRCASRASTCRTTTATGTPCTTRSPPRTRCTRRCVRHADARAAARRACTARCASTSTASSTCPRPACPTPTTGDLADARRVLRRAGRGRRRRQRGLRLPPRRRRPRPSSSPRSATRCSPRTPSSTGTRWSRPACARRTQWPEGSEEAALDPRRRRPLPRRAHADPPRAARPSCASPPASAAAKRSTKKPEPASGRGRDRCRKRGRSG